MAQLFKQIDQYGLSRLRELEKDMGEGVKLIALEKRPQLHDIKSRPLAFQQLERDLDTTLLVYFGSDETWRH
ncbi:hypothetical protein [Dehalogenimonas etheniformans]|uniref:Uncharacterized protein n=1 Tax=Dehalogenimonas etheniformans TaxID=1536648 RepID=A0A2P5P9M2_9CHLR|nr:hypothetical protein [Dehalogenimonas etheniformans]PPD58992.1 hypothetical protein JP09_003790 [Dehalogenimonas etheniformans]QNT76241.1 hypothetical protein HX448_05840 [Dehalogenimonas etheniformans]